MPINLPNAKVPQAEPVTLYDQAGEPVGAGLGPSSTPVTTGLVTGGATTGAGTAALAGGTYMWAVPTGTFSGATLQLQSTPDGTNWLSITGASLTAAGQWEVDFGAGELARVLITGGPPSGLTSYLRKVD